MKGMRSKASTGMDIDFGDPLYHDSVDHLTDPDVTMMESAATETVCFSSLATALFYRAERIIRS